MPNLSGRITRLGLVIDVRVMQSPQRVEALKKAGRPYSTPMIAQGLIDTGASCSALDPVIIRSLDLQPHGTVSIHTPSTGPAYETRAQYDACFVIGDPAEGALHLVRPVISVSLASEGFQALIGRDVLDHCVLTYDGPNNRFTLAYDVPATPGA